MTTSNPTTRGVVPSTYVQLLYEYLADSGVNAEALLGQPAPTATTGIGRFPIVDWQQYLQQASTALNDPLLGLHLAERISPRHFGVLGYVLLACGNVGNALQRLQQYHRLIYDVNPMHVETTDGQVELVWGLEMGQPGALVDETAVGSLLQFCRDITGQPNIRPLAVSFVNAAPKHCEPYTQWFGCPVKFEQTETRVTVSSELLTLPLRSADPVMIALLETQADELLFALRGEQPSELSIDVRQHISRLLRTGEPSSEQVAALMHITTRTLHRKLATEKTTYRQLLQETRHHLAKEYLQDSRLQLAEIALLLGYSEQSALSRAFKQWQGITPKRYRLGLASD